MDSYTGCTQFMNETSIRVFMTSILSLFSAVERAVNRFLLCFCCFSCIVLSLLVSNMKSGFSLLIKFQECLKIVSSSECCRARKFMYI